MQPAWKQTEFETFRFGWSTWDVQKAKALLLRKKRPIEIHSIEVQSLSPLASLVGIEWDRIKSDLKLPPDQQTIDLRVPLILVMTRDGALPIDGWHRIGKAMLTKTPTLPAVLLSKADERKVRISGPAY